MVSFIMLMMSPCHQCKYKTKQGEDRSLRSHNYFKVIMCSGMLIIKKNFHSSIQKWNHVTCLCLHTTTQYSGCKYFILVINKISVKFLFWGMDKIIKIRKLFTLPDNTTKTIYLLSITVYRGKFQRSQSKITNFKYDFLPFLT